MISYVLFLDSGEIFGIIPSKDSPLENFDLILLRDDGATAELSDDDEEPELGKTEDPKEQKATRKGDAAAWLANKEVNKTMTKMIKGEHEKTKFWNECSDFLSPGSVHDWDAMAAQWNMFVGKREKDNENNVVKFYRKQGSMLEHYYEFGAKSNNIRATLQPHLTRILSLNAAHRAPVDAPLTALNAPGPLATHGPNSVTAENREFNNMVPVVPLNMSNATVLTSQTSGPLVYPGQQPLLCGSKKRKLCRAPQVCATCGHYRHHNRTHNNNHQGSCAVGRDDYNSDRALQGWCPCVECMSCAENVGYAKPLLIEKIKINSLRTCNKCGHYKDHGQYKGHHTKSECNVNDLQIRIKYIGYCSCEKCDALASAMGQEKPAHPRKLYCKK